MNTLTRPGIVIQTRFAKGRDRFVFRHRTEPFTTAIIDPPWPYTAAPGKQGGSGSLSGFVKNRDAHDDQFETLSIKELMALPVGDVVGGYVMLWTTGPFLLQPNDKGNAQGVMRAWGFEPVSVITWAKWNKGRNGGYGGVGFWFLGNAEFCLVGKRKGWPSIRTGLSSLIAEPKTDHSIKPDNIHDICERRFPGPYLEMFGRRSRDGWVVIGDEAPGDGKDIRESLGELLGVNRVS